MLHGSPHDIVGKDQYGQDMTRQELWNYKGSRGLGGGHDYWDYDAKTGNYTPRLQKNTENR